MDWLPQRDVETHNRTVDARSPGAAPSKHIPPPPCTSKLKVRKTMVRRGPGLRQAGACTPGAVPKGNMWRTPAHTSPSPQLLQQGTRTQCAGKFQHSLNVLTVHLGHHELWNRSPFQPCASSSTIAHACPLGRNSHASDDSINHG